jgi:hypothetical protein
MSSFHVRDQVPHPYKTVGIFFLSESLKRGDHLEYVPVDGKVILKWVLKK